MAEEKEGQAIAPEPGKKSPIILIVDIVIVALLAAGGISFFITQQMMANSTGDGGGPSRLNHDPGVFIKLGDPKDGILVNVGGLKAGRFLKASIVLEMNPGKKDNIADGKLLAPAETKVMDVTLQTLRSLKVEELDAGKQDELKTTLRDSLNKALGEGSVYEVYITSFLMQ